MMRFVLSAALALSMAWFTPHPVTAQTAAREDAAYALAQRLSERISVCWFAGDETAFAAYRFSPETDSLSGRPRVLLVPRESPTARPLLVLTVDPSTLRNPAPRANVFGPLLDGPLRDRIIADLNRWRLGGNAC